MKTLTRFEMVTGVAGVVLVFTGLLLVSLPAAIIVLGTALVALALTMGDA